MEIDDLQREMDKMMFERNNRELPEFEGYSPYEMHQILHFTFSLNSPIQLLKLSDIDHKKIPIFNQIKYLADLILKSGELKLTDKGFLPTKTVSYLYNQGFIKDYYIKSGLSKLYKETDIMSINLTRMLIELSGIAKKRKNKLSLTKTGEKILSKNDEFLRLIIATLATRFNWAYYDAYGENNIGQLGYGFSLILLSKYGQEKRLCSFYAEKYFKAFPQILESINPTYGTIESYASRCYSVRTFERFLDYFGLIEIDEEGKGLDSTKYVRKTELFDKLIKCTPHKE